MYILTADCPNFSAGLPPSPVRIPTHVAGTHHHVSTDHGQQNTGHSGGTNKDSRYQLVTLLMK